ncbi:MAG: ribosomal protein S18-alanine N-acetyltransferase [Clostridiales bacterium]|jgi:ribosomal-protein-alanine N-acetyltransferase|nr:ribosomal protein S18-alanine N-acetyltransferase [Clostridiales bacterium]
MIRNAGIGDIKKIGGIEKENFHDAWSGEMIRGTLENPSGEAFVFEEDGRVVSYVCLLAACGEAEILRIGTEGKNKRKGYAGALVEYTLKSLKKRGIDSLFLEVRSDNLPAKKLYEKYGFQKIAVRKKYYGDTDAEIYKYVF